MVNLLETLIASWSFVEIQTCKTYVETSHNRFSRLTFIFVYIHTRLHQSLTTMELIQGGVYHLFNRSNAQETVFRTHEHFAYFSEKYQSMLSDYVDTVAYCLMRTHFHALIKVRDCDTSKLCMTIGKLQSSYTRAINRSCKRNGSLFQRHTKALPVYDLVYLKTLIAYIHQNPVRAGYVSTPELWQFSSYASMCDPQVSSIIQTIFPSKYFDSKNEFRTVHSTTIERSVIDELLLEQQEKRLKAKLDL